MKLNSARYSLGVDKFNLGMSALCKLCGSLSDLRYSHIMPDFYIRSSEGLQKTGTHGESKPHSFVVSTLPDYKDGWKQRNNWERQLGWKVKFPRRGGQGRERFMLVNFS